MTHRILIFEDEPPVLDALLEALAQSSPGEVFEVVWFQCGFREADEKSAFRCFEVIQESEAPKVYAFDGQTYDRPRPGKLKWFPFEFRAAVIDVWHESAFQAVGKRFLEELRAVRFDGPVVIPSRLGRDPSLEYALPNAKSVSKDDADWTGTAARRVKPPQARKRRSKRYIVNAWGRNHETLITDFFDEHRDETHRPDSSPQIYFGPHAPVSQQLSRFFAFEHHGAERYPLTEMKTVLDYAYEKEFGSKPSVLWVDTFDWKRADATGDERNNESVDEELVNFLCSSIGDRRPAPAVFVLGKDRRQGRDLGLERLNATIISRSDVAGDLSSFVVASFHNLKSAYESLEAAVNEANLKMSGVFVGETKMVERNGAGVPRVVDPVWTDNMSRAALQRIAPTWTPEMEEQALRLVQAALFPCAVARSLARLVGKGRYPSLAQWIDYDVGQKLNGSFSVHLRRFVNHLAALGKISKAQKAFYSPDRETDDA